MEWKVELVRPSEFVNSIGMPLQEALVFVNNALVGCGLRKHIRIIASGKMRQVLTWFA